MMSVSRFSNWSSVMAPFTVTSQYPPPSTMACSPPTQKVPTSTAKFETASATLDSGGPNEAPSQADSAKFGNANQVALGFSLQRALARPISALAQETPLRPRPGIANRPHH